MSLRNILGIPKPGFSTWSTIAEPEKKQKKARKKTASISASTYEKRRASRGKALARRNRSGRQSTILTTSSKLGG